MRKRVCVTRRKSVCHSTLECVSLDASLDAHSTPDILVRDNDRLYGQCFQQRVRSLGLDDRPTQLASPWQNGHVERLIGSIRRECLDHMVIFNEQHLRRVLEQYADYYNNDRTHVALGKDSPLPRAEERFGPLTSRPILNGLHHRYARIPPK